MAIIADLASPYEVADADGISNILANQFPTPGRAIAFVTTPELMESALDVSHFRPAVLGAVNPESPYLEPTIGQIWPR